MDGLNPKLQLKRYVSNIPYAAFLSSAHHSPQVSSKSQDRKWRKKWIRRGFFLGLFGEKAHILTKNK